MGFGSFLKKYAESMGGAVVSPATLPHTSVSEGMMLPATQNNNREGVDAADTANNRTYRTYKTYKENAGTEAETRDHRSGGAGGETGQSGDLVLREKLSRATLPAKTNGALTRITAPVRLHREISRIPREERMLRDEKCLYIKYCWEEKQRGATWEQAAKIVALEKAGAMPRLAARNMLHYNNLRNWRKLLCANPPQGKPKGEEPDFRYADNLIRNYGASGHMNGDELFCKQLYAVCLTKNLVILNKEYRSLAQKWLTAYPERKIPTLCSFRYWLKKMPPRLVALATKGPAFYAQHYQNYVPRDPDSIQVNEAWVGDNLECDFYIRTDDGRAVRPWLTAIQDIKSQYIVGMVLSDEGVDSADIRAALAGAVLTYGRPRIFLTDHGADFCKRGFTTPVVFTPGLSNSKAYEHCILKELDIEHRTAEPYNAKAKLVERFFHELNEYSRQARGWVGNCIENRPASAELWSRPENVRFLMDRKEAAAFIAEKIAMFHNKPAPDSKYLKGMSPAQAFQSPDRMNRPALSALSLAFAFLTPIPEARIVEPRGPSVKVGGIRYVAREGAENLWHYDNQPVMVKFDMQSIDYCFIFDLSGSFLAVAHAEEEIPYFADAKEEKEKLSDTLAGIRHEEKILRAMILAKTGGFERLDPRTIAMLPPEAFANNARVRLLDSQNKVKGNTHLAQIYVLSGEAAANLSDGSDRSDRSDGAGAGQEKRVSPATQISTEQKKHFLAAINGEDEIQPRRVFSAEEPKEEKENVKPVNPY